MAHRPRGAMDSVVERLRGQAPGHGMRVIDIVILVPLVRGNRLLINPRFANGAHDLLYVEAAGHEFPGEAVQKLGIGRRVAGPDVIDRLNDADAE